MEAGAHHGVTTMLLSRWVGSEGRVFAFDPVPNNIEIIHRNLELNQIHNVVVEHKAVGAKAGQISIPKGSNVQVGRGRADVMVELVALDSYLEHRPTLLKIDVEGFETQVLRGASSVLATRPKVALEVHTEILPSYDTSVKELFSFFDAKQYELWVQWDDKREPVRYHGEPINARVHLFALPHGSAA